MVEAVLKNLPEECNVVVVMDWSDGFWDKMKKSIWLLLQPDAKAVEINKCPNIAPWSQVFDKNIKRHITSRHFPVPPGTDEYHVAEMESTHPAGQIPLSPHA